MRFRVSCCLLLLVLSGVVYASSCANAQLAGQSAPVATTAPDSLRLKITANGQVYTARFVDSETTSAFIRLLPLTLRLSDLDGREKYSGLPARLPATGSVHTAYQTGDISYWLGGGLAAFYHQDGQQVKAGLIVLARLEGNATPFNTSGPVQATFEAVAP